jgi:hypothetical protein
MRPVPPMTTIFMMGSFCSADGRRMIDRVREDFVVLSK